MKRLELTKKLASLGISDRALAFSPANDRYCVIQRGPVWVISFTERGIETYCREFASEDEACEHALQLLTGSSGPQHP